MANNYTAVPHAYLDECEELTDAEFGRLMRALLKYGSGGGDTELPGLERILYPVFRANLERDLASYEKRAEKCRESARLGGLAKAANQEFLASL